MSLSQAATRNAVKHAARELGALSDAAAESRGELQKKFVESVETQGARSTHK